MQNSSFIKTPSRNPPWIHEQYVRVTSGVCDSFAVEGRCLTQNSSFFIEISSFACKFHHSLIKNHLKLQLRHLPPDPRQLPARGLETHAISQKCPLKSNCGGDCPCSYDPALGEGGRGYCRPMFLRIQNASLLVQNPSFLLQGHHF